MVKLIQSFSSNLKIRTKMIFLVCGVVLLSVLPLSLIVLYRNQAVVLDKTFEVCRNLANNIANLATEELLINETYDATRTSLSRLPQSEISGLINSYVLNIDGLYVADMNDTLLGEKPDSDRLEYFTSLTELTLSELNLDGVKVLQFIYPIFIEYKGEKMRVGTAVFDFDRDKVYEPVVQIRRTILVVSSILFGIGIIVALIAAFAFSRPIQILSEGARLIGDGDLNYRIPIEGKDEIGQLANTFNHMTHQIQDFTNNLESMVVQRTDELNKTLQEVQALKEAQDGDYYLTSLLLEPLQFNNNNTHNVVTDFFVEQKKKFKFRKWNSQIGGDICITDSIKLNGREYTVFMNGDAMGKSIQGAGGALVFGVVFNSGIMRSKIEKNSKVHPEIWLKERFLDLQNVFMTFDGSMYISVCMGLVDDVTGLMYYINAEHPWTVLYRDGKASFLEEELTLRKLGTPGQEDRFAIRVFQMMPGDVVFAGSDGRDDILITQDDGGTIMNEDEYEYLKRVEDASGDLNKIVGLLKDQGAITDDLSILRISFKEGREEEEIISIPYEVEEAIQEGYDLVQVGKEQEALERIEGLIHSEESYPELLKLLGNIYFNRKEYLKALDCFLSYSEINPGDNEYIYVISNTYRLLGQLNEAADYGERLYLRDSENYLNLINLSIVYKDLGIESRSRYMADKASAIDPKAKDLLKISENKEKVDSIIEYDNESLESELEKEVNADVVVFDEPDEEPEAKQLTSEDYVQLADESYQAKQYKESMENYLEACKLDPSNPWVHFRLGNCYSLLNDLPSAVQSYTESLKIAPRNHHAHNNIGSIYYRLKDYGKAKESWNRAIELKPDFQKAQINLSRLEKFEQDKLSATFKEDV
ncbi:MAG: tetratricopeptide repeat protein [Leptospira sp.]|nr:tetratricopeptide repeat protein [Leptospira sp.]